MQHHNRGRRLSMDTDHPAVKRKNRQLDAKCNQEGNEQPQLQLLRERRNGLCSSLHDDLKLFHIGRSGSGK
ncbi:Uncharacterised protein [Mycobacteroides abscessus subsp. abscessus]|nr:Uncharacterised protein [Mycobacteroides abscessus subsp. abscessus]